MTVDDTNGYTPFVRSGALCQIHSHVGEAEEKQDPEDESGDCREAASKAGPRGTPFKHRGGIARGSIPFAKMISRLA